MAVPARPLLVGIWEMTILDPPLHHPLTDPSSSRHFLHSKDVNGGCVVHGVMITPGAAEVNMFDGLSIANFRTCVLYCFSVLCFLGFCGEGPGAVVRPAFCVGNRTLRVAPWLRSQLENLC